MRKVDAKVERAANEPLNQFLSNETAALRLSGGSWPLSRLLRQAKFSVGDRVVIVHSDDFQLGQAELEKLAKKLVKAEKQVSKLEKQLVEAIVVNRELDEEEAANGDR